MANIQDMLNELQQIEVERLESKSHALIETIYPNLPEIITRTTHLTGIPEEILVRACIQASHHYEGVEWRHMLDYVRSFFLAMKRIEERKQKEGNQG